MAGRSVHSGKDRRRNVTIADVAAMAGVSKTLVSFVLNGRTDVSAAARERIEEAIRQLGYRPNRQARLLVRQRTGVVGIVMEIRTYTDLLVLHFVSGLGERLADAGYGLLLLRNRERDPLATLTSAVEEQKVDGFVLMDVQRQDPRVEWLEKAGFPYVLFSHTDELQASYVDVDYDVAARLVVDHLCERGHRRVGLVSGPGNYQYLHLRERAFRVAALARGLELHEAHYLVGDLTEASGFQAGTELAGMVDRPTAVFAVTDLMAMGTVRGLVDSGVRVPQQVAVIGFGDSPLASGTRPPLTTVRIPMNELGYVAAEKIMARIDGRPEGTLPHVALPRLIVRDSA